jgi:nicotinate-nucleotide adenylyltransferase
MIKILPQKGERVAILGGSFNPPHEGHIAMCSWILNTDRADRVWVIPSYEHPSGKELAPFEHRYLMSLLAFEKFGKKVEVLDIEKELGGVSSAVRTIEHLQRTYPDAEFSLALGYVGKSTREKWLDFDRLESMVNIIPISRGQGSHIPDVRATHVREKVKSGQSLAGLVPPGVAVYIITHQLYH